jgi:hypothetical protein
MYKSMKEYDANKCVLSVAGIGILCTLYCNIAVAFHWDRLIKKIMKRHNFFCLSYIFLSLLSLQATFFLDAKLNLLINTHNHLLHLVEDNKITITVLLVFIKLHGFTVI